MQRKSLLRIGWVAAAASLAAMPGAALAQPASAGGDINVPIVKLVLSLLVCAMVALLAALALKRLLANGALNLSKEKFSFAALTRAPQRRIQVMETHRVSIHGDICRLVCDEREYLVVVSAGGVALLRDQPIAQETAP